MMLPRYRALLLATLPLLAPGAGRAQNPIMPANAGSPAAGAALPVTVRVDADREMGPLPPVWRFFGADEPNFATMKDGRLLLAELGALRPGEVYFRAHNLLTSGDGTPALKWGSTNAYTEDAQGRPVYDWTIVDRIFDSYRARHVRPYVEIGFMPEALSTHPRPYQHDWRPGAGELFTGWSYPPKDYDRWGELVYRWVDHLVQRYGRPEVEHWYFEPWNEPNIGYWHGTRDEFFRLSDVTIAAVRRALPSARIVGPHMAGSDSTWLTAYLRHTLPAAGAPRTIDVVAFHAKGNPRNVGGHVVMGIAEQLVTMDRGFATVAREAQALPIIIGESDPEGCAACKGPSVAYRNGTLYSSYEAASIAHAYDLAARRHVTLEGVLTWAFEFEDQGYFPGFRVLASAGIDHPVLNVFRFLSRMPGRRIQVASSGALPLDSILAHGVRGAPDVGALAARDSDRVAVLLWNYHDDDLGGRDAELRLTIAGLPRGVREVTVTQQRIDSSHGNAYAAWLALGSPIAPSDAERARMKAAAAAPELGPPQRLPVVKGTITVPAALERQGVGLVQVTWGKAESSAAAQLPTR